MGGALTSASLAAEEVTVTAPNPHSTLFDQIAHSCDDHTFADVAFVFDGGEEVHAHKLILGLSSPTFAAMFRAGSGLAEADATRLARVPMDLFRVDVFRVALRYLYMGELPIEEVPEGSGGGEAAADATHDSPLVLRPTSEGVGALLELLRLADYLELTHLRQRCERVLVDWDVVQVENVVELYKHAKLCSAAQLVRTCVQYMRVMFDVVKETPEWAGLDDELKSVVQTLQ